MPNTSTTTAAAPPSKKRKTPSDAGASDGSARAVWHASEDALITFLRTTQPATPFAQIAERVSALPDSPGARTGLMTKNRWNNKLKKSGTDVAAGDEDKLMQAVAEVEGKHKWRMVKTVFVELGGDADVGMTVLKKCYARLVRGNLKWEGKGAKTKAKEGGGESDGDEDEE